MHQLPRSFYERDTIVVAKELLGKYLVHNDGIQERIGKIVEVEAYLGPHDLAAHSSKGLTKRTSVMFGPAGYTYVYMIYGIYYCTNVVTESEGIGAAVLLRALEPIKNIQERTQGPGLLSKAMRIDKKLNQHDLISETLYIATIDDEPDFTTVEKSRIGVQYAKEWAEKQLRFYIKGNPFVSKI